VSCSVSLQFTMPVTSLGHQEGRRVFWEGPKFLNYVQQCRTAVSPTHFPEREKKRAPSSYGSAVHSRPLHRLQKVAKRASALFYAWALLRNNWMATEADFVSKVPFKLWCRRFAARDCWMQTSWQVMHNGVTRDLTQGGKTQLKGAD